MNSFLKIKAALFAVLMVFVGFDSVFAQVTVDSIWELTITDERGNSLKAKAYIKGENGSFTTDRNHSGSLNCIRDSGNGRFSGRWTSGKTVGRFEVQVDFKSNVVEGWVIYGGRRIGKVKGRRR